MRCDPPKRRFILTVLHDVSQKIELFKFTTVRTSNQSRRSQFEQTPLSRPRNVRKPRRLMFHMNVAGRCSDIQHTGSPSWLGRSPACSTAYKDVATRGCGYLSCCVVVSITTKSRADVQFSCLLVPVPCRQIVTMRFAGYAETATEASEFLIIL
jgi:hypothetical protein